MPWMPCEPVDPVGPVGPVGPVAPAAPMRDTAPGHTPDAFGPYRLLAAVSR